MKKLKRKFTLRTALVTAATLALISSAAVFMAVSAADEVSPGDVSPADSLRASVSGVVSPTQTNEAPESLGDPVITMTTAKGEGETLNLDITGNNVFIDYGDGNPALYPGDRSVKGSDCLPFFANSVEGFSVEEHIDRRLWFTGQEGPWEWKGPLIREYGFAYGKFFETPSLSE